MSWSVHHMHSSVGRLESGRRLLAERRPLTTRFVTQRHSTFSDYPPFRSRVDFLTRDSQLACSSSAAHSMSKWYCEPQSRTNTRQIGTPVDRRLYSRVQRHEERR